ncbi:unnamed protein product [Pleuronectes platessa]|uniref:Uncharacterized protein n=1 Tax=Pleuronectes platessa TaxID=8262 RepID=A0A9N7YR33_PLEPL|nr:unnamed protein product [Pleuronectes platessa]
MRLQPPSWICNRKAPRPPGNTSILTTYGRAESNCINKQGRDHELKATGKKNVPISFTFPSAGRGCKTLILNRDTSCTSSSTALEGEKAFTEEEAGRGGIRLQEGTPSCEGSSFPQIPAGGPGCPETLWANKPSSMVCFILAFPEWTASYLE